jgi:hypothetical protein
MVSEQIVKELGGINAEPIRWIIVNSLFARKEIKRGFFFFG